MNKAEICKKVGNPLANNFLCYNLGATVILKQPRVPKKLKLKTPSKMELKKKKKVPNFMRLDTEDAII